MTLTLTAAKVLVASDNSDDAHQIQDQLQADFDHVRVSSDPQKALQDFADLKPQVLVLAFDSLDKAQRYYLGLYRLDPSLPQHPHRSVLLCGKDDVRAAFQLCKQQVFDDYVLYWPHTHDGPRLAMSVWSACRQMMALRGDVPSPAALSVHARHLDELDRVVTREVAEAAEQSAGACGVELMDARARRFKDAVEPALSATRPMADQLHHMRRLVMVVEDDAFAQQLVRRSLDPEAWDTVFAADGASALAQLRHLRPDVILMDIRMPGIDGVSLTRRLRAAPNLAQIPVIMVTGDARKETLIISMQAGADGFLIKPFTRESLTAKLEKVLSSV